MVCEIERIVCVCGGGGGVVLGIIYSYCLLGDDGRLQ